VTDDVTLEQIEDISTHMLTLLEEGVSDFTLAINSSGGNAAAVLCFRDMCNTIATPHTLTGVTFSECGSAALALLQCCTTRISLKQCGFFIHHLQMTRTTAVDGTENAYFTHTLENERKISEAIVSLQCARTGISKREWRTLANQGEKYGAVIFPSHAKKLGLIDKVVEKYSIF
jgi:ATP-dependent protease ClpP protease subunit